MKRGPESPKVEDLLEIYDGGQGDEMSQGSSRDRRIDTRVDKIHLVQVSRFDEEGFRADLATGRT